MNMDDVDRLNAVADYLDAEDERRGRPPGEMQADLRRIASNLATSATRWAVLGDTSVRLSHVESAVKHPDGIVLRMASGREHIVTLDDDEIADLLRVLRT